MCMSSSGLCRGRGACGVRCAGRRDRCPAIARLLLYPGAAMPSSGRLPNPPFAARDPLRAEFAGSAGWRKRPLLCQGSVLYHLLNAASPELRKGETSTKRQQKARSSSSCSISLTSRKSSCTAATLARAQQHIPCCQTRRRRLGPRLRPFDPRT
jgi:hypothetical protein